MTSKEYIKSKLEYLTRYEPSLSFDIDMYEKILQDLERLEVFEKENVELRQEVSALEDYSYDVDCEKELLIKENKKLKNAIECIKKCVKIIVKDCDLPIYDTPRYTLGIRAHYWEENPNGLIVYIKKEEYELLKEVLDK